MSQDERIQKELHFLVLQYLSQPGLQDAYSAFVKCTLQSSDNALSLPSSSNERKYDVPGARIHKLLDLKKEFSHVQPDYLLETLRAAKRVINAGPAPGLLTILGHSSHTLPALLDKARLGSEWEHKQSKSNNMLVHLCARSYGTANIKRILAEKAAKSPVLVARILGHLAPVYCVVIDKTGTVAVTGADDALVKIWSLERYYLLATLRGHKKEITDLAINARNTMIASGSCDKEIRIWCLQTTRHLTVLTGHRSAITSLHFSPNDDYLTTSGNDGLVCFWPITGPKTISDEPMTFFERVRTVDKLLSSSFSAGGTVLAVGSSDGDIFTYTMQGELGLPAKSVTLEGHTAMVITLTFAKRSLRFVSGSKDGTVRVWKRSEGSWDHVVCNARQPIVPDRDPKEQIDVLVAQWSCNEAQVLASCSDTSIRMWNTAGQLLQTFLGHDDEVYFVQEHPLITDVLVTCGHDGHIITWSMESGCALNTFLNVIEGEGRASVHEASFTLDGETFITVDANGHITIFGNEMLRDYVSVPREQFFSSDYLSLIRDRFSNVLDEQTELPPHFIGPPYLVDQQGMALPPEIQGDIPGRHILSVAEIKEQKKRKKRKRILDFVRRQTTPRGRFSSGDALLGAPLSNPELADFQRSFVAEPGDPDPHYIPPVQAPTSTYNLFEGILANSIAMIDPERSRELWLNRKIAPALSTIQYAQARQDRKKREELKNLRESQPVHVIDRTRNCKSARNTRKRTGATRTRQSRQSEPVVYESLSSSDETRSQQEADSSDVDWQVSEMRQKRKPVIREEPASSDEETATENEDGAGHAEESETNARNSQKSSSEDENEERNGKEEMKEEGEDDTETTVDTPRQTSRKRRRIRKPRRLTSEESILDETVLDSIRCPRRETPAKERAIRRVKKMLNINKSSKKKSSKKCTRDSDSGKESGVKSQDEANKDEVMEVMEQYKPPAWLTAIRPTRSPFLPQIWDKIYYFVQGHMDYVNSEHCPPEAQKTRPWELRTFERHAEPCKVLSLSFVTGPPTLCQIKLGVLNDDDEVEETFIFKYNDAPNIPDFMVLKQHYEDSVSQRWIEGDKFRSLIDDQWWEGNVISKSSVDSESFPESPWRRIKVQWDTEPDVERLSAWDIEPLPKDARSSKRRSPSKKHSHGDGSSSSRHQFAFGTANTNTGPLDPYILGYYHRHGTWGQETREEFRERFSNALIQVMELSEAQEFLYPVNFNDHPDYYMIIGYPVDLTTIHNRLLEHHYRSVESVLWEIRQLEINARVYNEDASEIVGDVTSLVTRLSIFIKSTLLKQIDEEITNEMIAAEIENRNKTKKRKRRLRCRSENKTEWFERASNILEQLITSPDSQPFRSPVDLGIYNDYLKYCQEPMDLETIADKLHGGSYTNEAEFYSDIDLVFTNSLNYNTRSSSQIYKMTWRLKEYYLSLIDHLADTSHDVIVLDDTPDRRPKIASPLQLVVPRSKRRQSSGNSADSSRAETKHPKRKEETKPSKGKERVSVSRNKRRIYTSSEEEDRATSPVIVESSSKSSQRSSRRSQSAEKISSQEDNEEASSGESAAGEKRSRRSKKQVPYEEYYEFSSEQEGSGEEEEEEHSSATVGSWEGNKPNKKKKVKSSKRTSARKRRKQTNGRVKSVRRAEHASSTSESNQEEEDGEEEEDGSSSSDNKGRRRTRSKKRRKISETLVTTQRGRNVKKNVRYDDFF